MRNAEFRALRALGAIVVLACAAGAQRPVWGCPYSFRQAGFIVRESSPYRLCLLARNETPGTESLSAWLEEAAAECLRDSNVRAEWVDIDEDLDQELASALQALNVTQYPAAALISPRGGSWLLGGLAPGQIDKSAVEALAREAVSSPAREALKARVVSDWCVALLVKGADEEESKMAEESLRAAAAEVLGSPTEMGETIQRAPFVLTVAADDPREKVFLETLGLREAEDGGPRGAILFGKARRFGPVLEGGYLEESFAASLMRFLGNNCACTADPRWLSGPAAPLDWPLDMRQQTRDMLGFDPDSPMAAMAVAAVQALVDPQGALTEDWLGAPDPLLGGYREFYLDGEREEAEESGGVEEERQMAAAAPPAKGPSIGAAESPGAVPGRGAAQSATRRSEPAPPAASLTKQTRRATAMALGGMAILAALGGLALAAAKRRRN